MKVHTEDRAICASNFSDFYDTAVFAIPPGKLVTYALAKHRNEAWLNRVWKEKPKMKSTLTIPIIDIGWETINYDSIGDGIRMAESGSRRMILAGQTPIWISFTDTDSFMISLNEFVRSLWNALHRILKVQSVYLTKLRL